MIDVFERKTFCDKYDLLENLWSGAVDTVECLTEEEVETVLNLLSDGYFGEPIDITTLNDFFWFDDDTIADWLGYEDFEEIRERGEK